MHNIIIYDGICGFCNKWILFILDHQPDRTLRFISFQSKKAKVYLEKYDIKDISTIVFIENNTCYKHSTAILKIVKHLNSTWRYFHYFIYVPSIIRDYIYIFIARNRYKLMNKKHQCRILLSHEKDLFLD